MVNSAMVDILSVVIAGLLAVIVVLQVIAFFRRRADKSPEVSGQITREIREELSISRKETRESALDQRKELSGGLNEFSRTLQQQMAGIASIQNNQIDSFAQQLAKLVESNELRLKEVRDTLDRKLKELQVENTAKLEEMRKTVDEKLHATLEKRLGESFKQVSDRLEQVHKGLGEMQTLAAGVGDLKRVLTNVKSRGTWGEMQLATLLDQVLTSDQYAVNVATLPGSSDRVEFAIRLPGGGENQPLWLPIDSKFPREDYERLQLAQDRADPEGVEEASRALEVRLKNEARTLHEKYIGPPHTTDFGILFLPTEGLYAEVLRRPGLSDYLQREYRVTLAGPTTLTALLNSLQMGFRTLAIEKRTSEVWQLLSAVKTEFGRFGDVLARTKDQLETVTRSIGQAETRTRQMAKKLKDVEALPVPQAAKLLEELEAPEEDDAAA
jgi:DNA recombination protein RmuC